MKKLKGYTVEDLDNKIQDLLKEHQIIKNSYTIIKDYWDAGLVTVFASDLLGDYANPFQNLIGFTGTMIISLAAHKYEDSRFVRNSYLAIGSWILSNSEGVSLKVTVGNYIIGLLMLSGAGVSEYHRILHPTEIENYNNEHLEDKI